MSALDFPFIIAHVKAGAIRRGLFLCTEFDILEFLSESEMSLT